VKDFTINSVILTDSLTNGIIFQELERNFQRLEGNLMNFFLNFEGIQQNLYNFNLQFFEFFKLK
jgi:hypothetical protein